MKKKLWYMIAIGIFLLTACGGTPLPAQTEPVPVVDTATPSPLPTATQTAIPTETPTASFTSLPTIPTFTATFDARTIVTVTPAAKAECPQEDPSVVAKFATPNGDGSHEPYRMPQVLDYLNAGGTLDGLQNSGLEETSDLTGDGLHEVFYREFGYSFFVCKDGHYQDLLYFVGDFGASLADVIDLNKNGIPEIILFDIVHYGYVDVSVYEWDGSKFRSLIDMGRLNSLDLPIDWVSFNNDGYKLIDTNGDGLTEIVVVHDIHQQARGVLGGHEIAVQRPLRDQTIILGWNGQNYVNIKQGTHAPPEYRFQAVQDGDEQVRYGNYTAALSFYQAAIFGDRLEWWSPERREYEIFVLVSQYEPTPAVFPTPIPDNTEYHRLAAYAYYRIMLLHFAQGHESDAGTVYKTLEKKFGSNPYGQPYVEMAKAFWDTYQSTHKMYNSCAVAIEYAVDHPEILVPLGSDYHGSYSHTYVPADVCPFR